MLARQEVAENPGTMHEWSRRGRKISGISIAISLTLGLTLGFGLGLQSEELLATAALFTVSGMSASRSIDANILIVAGCTRQYGMANLAASATVCLGIVAAFAAGILSLWLVIALNAASLISQMILIVRSRRRLLKSTLAQPSQYVRFVSLIGRAWRAWRSQVVEALAIKADSILIISQASVHIVGLYAVMALVPQISYQIFQTVIQHSYASAPLMRLRERTRLLWQVCVLMSIPLAGVAAVGAILLVPMLFGPAFSESLNWLVPACLVAIALASLAPALQHFALSNRDSWFPFVLLGCVLVAVACGLFFNSAVSLTIMASLFFGTGSLYVFLAAGPKMFAFSWTAIRRIL
ncbi:hypothetical protein AB4Y81_03620 [Paenarthrobacter sp. TAF1]|uniref:hypothetical protein n=1 Tax=Paenarthrobacter sp. TAF1 TaxID=3233067 RepID=UPI003F9CF75B